MDCKKALVEANGDIDLAIENMRKAGQARGVKKAGRITAEGSLGVLTDASNKKAVIIEINCETDFVAREAQFQQFVKEVASLSLDKEVSELESLSSLPTKANPAQTVEEYRLELIGKLGENISMRRMHLQKTQGVIATYGHGDANGIRIATVVALKNGTPELAKDLAMHVAAMNPEYIVESEVPQSRIDKEKEIYLTQTREKEVGKPEAMIEKIVENKLKKFVSEISLLGQAFVKEPSVKIENLLKSHKAEVEFFLRYEVGEGIEKKEDNFVAEVMNQARGAVS